VGVWVGMYIYIIKAGDEMRELLASAAAERKRWFPAKERGNRLGYIYVYTIYRRIDR